MNATLFMAVVTSTAFGLMIGGNFALIDVIRRLQRENRLHKALLKEIKEELQKMLDEAKELTDEVETNVAS